MAFERRLGHCQQRRGYLLLVAYYILQLSGLAQ